MILHLCRSHHRSVLPGPNRSWLNPRQIHVSLIATSAVSPSLNSPASTGLPFHLGTIIGDAN